MLRILLALVVIAVIFSMNPLFKKSPVSETNQTHVQKTVDDVTKQVNEAKRLTQQQFDEVNND
ncbi:hypothetical protein IJV79_02370 [bacterium]|nr:hypothetical protein [bacterium]